jgi:hypothetical protein
MFSNSLATLSVLLSTLLIAPPAPASQAAPGATEQAPAPEASLMEMLRALSRFLTDEELELVYEYLWDASIASLKGSSDEVELPPELAFKLAILQKRIVKEGGHYLDGLARQMAQDLDRWQKDLTTPPPPVPYDLPQNRAGAATKP